MRAFEELEAELGRDWNSIPAGDAATRMLAIGEAVLENWISGRGETPTSESREGFRLLALHRQGAKGEPSFNACRETCRELAFHYNLITLAPDGEEDAKRVVLMSMIANHLLLFVSGKMQVEQLGEFCCASKPIRSNMELQCSQVIAQEY